MTKLSEEVICIDQVTQWTWDNGNAPKQLACLTQNVWTDKEGRFCFPYHALATVDYWDKVMRPLYTEQKAFSWIVVCNGILYGHIALINKSTHWELGRMMARGDAPKGTMSVLVQEACEFARKNKIIFQVECSQYHTTSQWICFNVAKLRFAGIGILDNPEVSGHNEHCYNIYFDNSLDLQPFEPKRGILANPCGIDISYELRHASRLVHIQENLTTDRGTKLVSSRFHILPEFATIVRQIISFNLSVAA